MKIRHLLITAACIGALANAAQAKSAEDFVKKASMANEFEIETSQAALEKSHNDHVKKLAQKMIDDHTATGEKLKDTLASAHIDVAPADKLDDEHAARLSKLQSESDDAFDGHYLKLQEHAHKEAIKLFTDEAQNGDDAALKKFAAQTLPALKMHLAHVQKLEANMGK